jgi:hypothetical protein
MYDDPGEFQNHRDQHEMESEWFLVGLELLGCLATRQEQDFQKVSVLLNYLPTVPTQVILITRLTKHEMIKPLDKSIVILQSSSVRYLVSGSGQRIDCVPISSSIYLAGTLKNRRLVVDVICAQSFPSTISELDIC